MYLSIIWILNALSATARRAGLLQIFLRHRTCMNAALALSTGVALALLPLVQSAEANCDDPVASQLVARVAHFKRVGDCALLPGIMALSDRHFAYGASHCPNWRRVNAHAEVERALRAFCRTNSAAAKKQQQEQRQKQKQVATSQSPPSPVPSRVAVPRSTSCSDITGTDAGGPSPPSNCMTPGSAPPNLPQAQSSVSSSPAPRVVVLSPPQCSMCDVLKTVGEVLPDLAEKLNNINTETINDIEPPLLGGGPNTLRPFLPRRPLSPVTEPQDPLDAINDLKDIATDAKALNDLTDKSSKEPEDYAETCQNGFRDAAWKAFTAKDGNYAEKAKAARDSLKECWKAAAKYIENEIANGGVNSAPLLGDN